VRCDTDGHSASTYGIETVYASIAGHHPASVLRAVLCVCDDDGDGGGSDGSGSNSDNPFVVATSAYPHEPGASSVRASMPHIRDVP